MIGLAIGAAVIAMVAAVYVLAPLRGTGIPRWAGPVSAGLLIAAVGGVYWLGGSPEQPGSPYAGAAAERRAADPATLDTAGRIERLRDVLRTDDQDADGWAMLGRELARDGRELEAINAFQRALGLDPQARTFSDLGQTIINLNEGEVTHDARSAFEAAAREDPDLPEAGFFLGLGAYQDGDREAATRYWTEVLDRLEPGNPFRAIIARQAAELLSRPDVDASAVAAAQAGDDEPMSPQDRIAGMIARLDGRVAGGNAPLSDYLVLIRVRAMMDDTAGAREALAGARAAHENNSGAQAILDVADQALGNATGDE